MDIEMKDVVPNIMIFRSEDGDFVEYDLDESFNMTGEPRYFHVLPEDNYNTMRDDHIVVAEKISEGSHDLCRFSIGENDQETPAVVWKIEKEELNKIVSYLCHQALKHLHKVN